MYDELLIIVTTQLFPNTELDRDLTMYLHQQTKWVECYAASGGKVFFVLSVTSRHAWPSVASVPTTRRMHGIAQYTFFTCLQCFNYWALTKVHYIKVVTLLIAHRLMLCFQNPIFLPSIFLHIMGRCVPHMDEYPVRVSRCMRVR